MAGDLHDAAADWQRALKARQRTGSAAASLAAPRARGARRRRGLEVQVRRLDGGRDQRRALLQIAQREHFHR